MIRGMDSTTTGSPERRRYRRGRVLLDGALVRADLVVDGELIVEVVVDPRHGDLDDGDIDCGGLVIAPGFIDLQCNGAGGVDITTDLVPVVPGAHYFCGGVWVDEWGQSTTHNLYAVGEVSCSGIHGANRLMGNSLLDIIVFGRIAGASAAEFAKNAFKDGALHLDHVVAYNKEVVASGSADGRVSPMLIPMYTDERVRERQLTAHYVGNVR